MNCQPRPEPVVLQGRIKPKTPWDFNLSVFKQYKPDTQKILDMAFETDWNYTRCEKVLKTEEDYAKVKAFLKQHWKAYREVYKHFAGLSPLGRVACVGSGGL